MKFFRYIYFFGLLMMVQITGCKQVYTPPAVPMNSSYLVVDGTLFSGNDSSLIRLTRSRSLADTTPMVNELNALVSVVNANGVEYPFTDEGNGNYVINQLNLDNTQLYRLKIISTDGNEYLSDSVPVRTTPPIDSIYWNQSDTGIRVTLNTGDPANNTRYYRWEFVETWEYQTNYVSYLEYVNGQAVYRPPADQIYTCYQYGYSTDINVLTTNNLSQDLVNQQFITSIPTGSEKISREYSLLIKQYALTKDAFTFWQNLKANSQDLGSLFDLQPYTQLGNLHCVNNPAIPVIGYVSFCTLQQKRLFINYKDLNIYWAYSPYYGECTLATVGAGNLSDIFPVTGPPYFFTLTGQTPTGDYLYSTNICVDCRTHGGTTSKPSFMP